MTTEKQKQDNQDSLDKVEDAFSKLYEQMDKLEDIVNEIKRTIYKIQIDDSVNGKPTEDNSPENGEG